MAKVRPPPSDVVGAATRVESLSPAVSSVGEMPPDSTPPKRPPGGGFDQGGDRFGTPGASSSLLGSGSRESGDAGLLPMAAMLQKRHGSQAATDGEGFAISPQAGSFDMDLPPSERVSLTPTLPGKAGAFISPPPAPGGRGTVANCNQALHAAFRGGLVQSGRGGGEAGGVRPPPRQNGTPPVPMPPWAAGAEDRHVVNDPQPPRVARQPTWVIAEVVDFRLEALASEEAARAEADERRMAIAAWRPSVRCGAEPGIFDMCSRPCTDRDDEKDFCGHL